MNRKLTLTMVLSVFLLNAPAQNTRNSQVMKAFSDSLKNISASYFAYYRMWEDPSLPTPRGIKPNPDYYKLFVPPTYYVSPVEQAFGFEWEPSDRLGMSATDSLYQAKPDTLPVFELPDMERTAKADRWVNKLLLNYYLQYPERVTGNELYFADVTYLDESRLDRKPRKEKMKEYMQVEDPVGKADAVNDLIVLKPNFWTKTGSASIHFSQYGISDNWYQGGESTNSLLSELKLTANYNDRQRVEFENSLEFKLGFITAPSDTVHEYKTNADLLRLNSKLGIKAFKNWYYTLTSTVKTQLFPNYKTNTNELVSNFLAPLNIDVSVGMDYKLEKTKYKLSVAALPFSYSFVYLKEDDLVNPTSFNVEAGRTTASMFGSKVTANLDWKIASNISLVSKFDYFTTYEKVIASWENTFNFKLNRYLTTQLFLHARFDDGVTLTEDNTTYFQFKEMLTFGLSYTW